MSIDEISMVGSRMFSHINRRLQQIFRSTTFFGGLSVIVVGDLKQLAPVGDQWIFQPSKMNGLQELAGTLLWELFEHFELKKKKKIMRQRDDLLFATALNNLANGTLTPEDKALFNSRCFKPCPPDFTKSITLFATNIAVCKHNETALNKMTTKGDVFTAIDTVLGEGTQSTKDDLFKSIENVRS